MFPLGEATQAVSPSPRLLDFFHSPRAGIVEKTGYRYPRISEKTDAGTSSALLLAPGTSTQWTCYCCVVFSMDRAKSGTVGSSGNELSCLKVRGRLFNNNLGGPAGERFLGLISRWNSVDMTRRNGRLIFGLLLVLANGTNKLTRSIAFCHFGPPFLGCSLLRSRHHQESQPASSYTTPLRYFCTGSGVEMRTQFPRCPTERRYVLRVT